MDKLNMIVAYAHARFASMERRNDEGATAVEYSLLAALIAGLCIVAVTAFGTQIASVFSTLTTKIKIT
ncbi:MULTISPECIES: Flp family type IVb pilin [Actinoplanes]|uniref:Pilus assembly protein n=2 Tax=Actinoplanes TaxID=1865 RepID=A0A101JJC3_9ACTN|nr:MULTISPECIES: Flp family type IVb pilin [Actinoplanes]KUL27899.1 hypothetical protein ADL15_34285 [Actinoplanes awajinensis subsp. mycoplanecinus]GIE66083.1 hypothetical protein Apa02nite_021910 [Actinoplanes palleronii]